MNKRLKKFITSMKKRGIKYLCGNEQTVIITFVKMFGDDAYLEYVIRIAVDDLRLHNVNPIDGYVNKRHIDEIEKIIEKSREESEEK